MDKAKNHIYKAYTKWVAENKTRPEFIEAFIIEAGISQPIFLKHFNTFNSLEQCFWRDIFEEAVTLAAAQSEFSSYSVNEKMLGIYFTWMELLKAYRDFAAFVMNDLPVYSIYPSILVSMKSYFEKVAGQLIEEGIATGEIASRPWITNKYSSLLWSQPVMIIRFWVKDTSENFADTDALIEKTVNFSFDLMRSNSLDSFVDLAKFHFQHR